MHHPSPIVDADGALQDSSTPERRGVGVKRLIFDWSSVVAIAIAAMTWATLAGDVRANKAEIDRLRAAKEQQTVWQQDVIATMAKRTDVEKVSDKVDALAAELRGARVVR